MGKATAICKICGKEYPYCNTLRDEGLFRWQDVACCQEHGSQYFAEVIAARAKDDNHAQDEAGKTAKEYTVVHTDTNDASRDAANESDNSLTNDIDDEDDDVFADDGEEDKDFDGFWYEEEFDN